MSSFSECNYIIVSLSGKIYSLRRPGILKYSEQRAKAGISPTLLEKFVGKFSHQERLNYAEDYTPLTDSYYFSRSAELFDSVLDFHQTNELHIPKNICKDRFFRELDFWEIPKSCISHCCSGEISVSNIPIENLGAESVPFIEKDYKYPTSRDVESPVPSESSLNLDQFKNVPFSQYRLTLWKFFEDPTSSMAAKCFAFASGTVVLISICALVLGTMPQMQVFNEDENLISNYSMMTIGQCMVLHEMTMVDQCFLFNELHTYGVPHPVFDILEFFCVLWFSLEYFTRLLIVVNRWKHVKKTMNMIDLASIAPFYVELIFYASGLIGNESKLRNLRSLLLTLRILRILRVARVFRLARYSGSMQAFGQTMQASKKEFGMLIVYMSISVLLFATGVYFMEKDEPNTKFESIPASFWWCVVTMTTVGYGDMIPRTVGGKLIASLTSVSGVIVLAFPVTMIVTNFNILYQQSTKLHKFEEDGPHRKLSRAASRRCSHIRQAHSVVLI